MLLAVFPARVPALEVSEITFQKNRYLVAKVAPTTDQLELFCSGDNGKPLGSLANLKRHTALQGKELLFAMNAGMFHADQGPVGLCVIQSKEIHPLNTDEGNGNFFLKPNGVFFSDSSGFHLLSTPSYAKEKRTPIWATQSGPVLVINKEIHPEFRSGSPNLHIRNGAGVDEAGHAFLAVSCEPISFYDFALLFRDHLKCPNALFLDGSICSTFAPTAKHECTRGARLGPLLGITKLK